MWKKYMPIFQNREYLDVYFYSLPVKPMICIHDGWNDPTEDEDGVGFITFRNLTSIMKDCFEGVEGDEGISYSDDELQEMLDKANRDGGRVLN